MADKDNTPKEQPFKSEVDAIKAAFRQAVKGQIGGDAKHGWGAEDSVEVICEVATQWAENEEEVRGTEEVFKVFQACVKEVVNPSQFRQKIEGTEEEVAKGKALLVKGPGRAEKVKGLIDELI